MDNSKRKYHVIANFAITFMLICMIFVAFSYNTHYVFNENKVEPYYRGSNENKCVSLMFNVYTGTQYLDGILDVLSRYNVKATFFVGGCWVEKNSDYLLKIHEQGHEIGNHGYFHKDHDKLDSRGNYNEIEPNNLLIEKYIYERPMLFAPPSGAFNKNTLSVAHELNMKTIMWSKDTIDWRDHDVDLIVKRATKNLQNGDLILCHPTKCTLEALPKILDFYRNNDFQEVNVSSII